MRNTGKKNVPAQNNNSLFTKKNMVNRERNCFNIVIRKYDKTASLPISLIVGKWTTRNCVTLREVLCSSLHIYLPSITFYPPLLS